MVVITNHRFAAMDNDANISHVARVELSFPSWLPQDNFQFHFHVMQFGGCATLLGSSSVVKLLVSFMPPPLAFVYFLFFG